MQFKPLTDKELEDNQKQFEPWPEGVYDFTVVEASEMTSKKGNQMIRLRIRCLNVEGQQRFVFDYLLEAMEFKLKHFCETAGLLEEYDSGNLNAAMCLDRSGQVKLRIDKQEGYDPKNVVEDYVKPVQAEGDDGIPF